MEQGFRNCVLVIEKNCNVHTWINVCYYLCSFCEHKVILCLCVLNENMVKPVQNEAALLYSFAGNTEQIETCESRRNVSLFRELYEWFGKLGQMNQL